ncbi:hypothetical protein RHSIM_Rhsim07G0019200 [Rhododendron simsii]|uniref:Uncharacterized protein n=1 Tax=Rhododendron simsii TaxID=118357 RepID=A0A834LKC5_RHOSS|nr:hypothetical protein RHSIM_Rhsim07G0019200 [Rhododendron simsii]
MMPLPKCCCRWLDYFILVADWDNKLELVYEASLYSTAGLAAHSIFFYLGIPFLRKIGTCPVQVFLVRD